MVPTHSFADRNGHVQRYDYENESVVVADTGFLDGEASVDVVDGTAIVVVETRGENAQYELDLPPGDVARAFINNGVVTVEVSR